jgi:hypothetical protein
VDSPQVDAKLPTNRIVTVDEPPRVLMPSEAEMRKLAD